MEIFKTFHLKPKLLAIIPTLGYENRRTQSFVSNLFLEYIESIRNKD